MKAYSEWGLNGVQSLRGAVAVLIIVDVLSFSTAVDIALAAGATVLPFPYGDQAEAERTALAAKAITAKPRRTGGEFSLSPHSLINLPAGTRLLLPSPNGSRLSLEGGPARVITGCFRNATAVAEVALALADGGDVAVIPAGERWRDGSLRPAIEDLLAAGAILSALRLPLSSEAAVASAAFENVGRDLAEVVRASVSGRELIDSGFGEDVELAMASDVSRLVPLLTAGEYRP